MTASGLAPVPADRPGDDVAVIELIAAQQADPTRRLAAVGLEADGIRGELDEFDPPWLDVLRVVRGPDGGVVGACSIEWDLEVGRAWIVGPWVAVEDAAWVEPARALVDAVVAQAPAEVTRFELAGETVAAVVAELAAGLGWGAGEANHVLLADAEVVGAWAAPPAGAPLVRSAELVDVAAIAAVHDVEFPATYASAERLVVDGAAGERVSLVAVDGDGAVLGYAAGKVHGDGEGFIEFLGVAPEGRGQGTGAVLVRALSTQLLAASSMGRVALTVQDHRDGARAFYARLGFRSDGAFVAYGTER